MIAHDIGTRNTYYNMQQSDPNSSILTKHLVIL